MSKVKVSSLRTCFSRLGSWLMGPAHFSNLLSSQSSPLTMPSFIGLFFFLFFSQGVHLAFSYPKVLDLLFFLPGMCPSLSSPVGSFSSFRTHHLMYLPPKRVLPWSSYLKQVSIILFSILSSYLFPSLHYHNQKLSYLFVYYLLSVSPTRR